MGDKKDEQRWQGESAPSTANDPASALMNLAMVARRLNRVDRHLIDVLSVRVGPTSLSNIVAAIKKERAEKGPEAEREQIPNLIRLDIESQRLASSAARAKKHGMNPAFAMQLLYAIISESCRTQMEYLHSHQGSEEIPIIISDDPAELAAFHRKQLLELTEAVAPNYDRGYGAGHLATRLYRRFEDQQIKDLVSGLKDVGTAIDLGCATGIKTLLLAPHFQEVIGYDVSPAMIATAQAKLQPESDGNVKFVLHDLEDGIPLPDSSVSLALMNLGTASDINNITRLIAEVRRVLRKGGRFLFSFYSSESLQMQLGFLPWPMPLVATLDPDSRSLDVHIDKRVYQIQATAYRVKEVQAMFRTACLRVNNVFTHPTLSAVLPEDILSDVKFGEYGPQATYDQPSGKGDQKKGPLLAHYLTTVPKITENGSVQRLIERFDVDLASSKKWRLGAYIIVTGVKEK